MNETNNLIEMEILFSVLADKTRLRILNLIRRDEICVYYFTEVLKESQPKVSRHLAYMRNSGIVSGRREGKWINYKINFPTNPFAAQLLDNTLEWMESQIDMREEYQQLIQTYRTDKFFVNSSNESTQNISAETDTNGRKKEELDIFLL